jgi:hypothetical protein
MTSLKSSLRLAETFTEPKIDYAFWRSEMPRSVGASEFPVGEFLFFEISTWRVSNRRDKPG